MQCLTPVQPAWISALATDCPLLTWSPPLASPQPFYDAADDEVKCYAVPYFGVHKWELAPVQKSLIDAVNVAGEEEVASSSSSTPLGFRKIDEAYRWFARLLLEGSIPIGLRGALSKEKLKEPASALTQMKPIPRVSSLLRLLVTHKIVTRAAFLAQIKQQPTFLCEELAAFLQIDERKAFRQHYARISSS